MLALAVAAGAARDPAAELRSAVRAHLEQRGVVGCSIAIAEGGRVVFSEGFGYANLEARAPATPETVYRLASISKPITAVAVLRLAEAGLVDLDADIRKYLPEFPDKGAVITVRHILSHTSGIRHYRGNESLRNERFTGPIPALAIFKDDPLEHPPGEQYTYSTYGYTVLAALIEKVTGKPYPDAMRHLVWEPAGMTATDVEDQRRIVLNRAAGYEASPDGGYLNSRQVDLSYKWGGGGLVSTVTDLCSFAGALLEDRILSSEWRAKMWSRARLSDGTEIPYGLGWGVTRYRGELLISHNGAQQGSRTSLWILPERGVVIAVLTNYESHNVNDLINLVADTWLHSKTR